MNTFKENGIQAIREAYEADTLMMDMPEGMSLDDYIQESLDGKRVPLIIEDHPKSGKYLFHWRFVDEDVHVTWLCGDQWAALLKRYG